MGTIITRKRSIIKQMCMMAEKQPIAMMANKCTTMVANQNASSGSIMVDSYNGVSRMNKTFL